MWITASSIWWRLTECVSLSINLRAAWVCMWCQDIHKTLLPWYPCPRPNQGVRWIQHGIFNSLRPISIHCNAIWFQNSAGNVPGFHRWWPKPIHWRLRSALPWRRTHIFHKPDGTWGAFAPSAAATNGIRPVLKTQELPIWSFRSRFGGFVITSEGNSVEEDQISLIEDWPTPQLISDV